MKEIGMFLITLVMVKECKSGLMGQSMRDTGGSTRLTEEEDSFMQMAMFTKENGRKTKLTAMAFTSIRMEPSMRVIGKKISSMDMEKKHGQMELAMKENIEKEKKTAMGNSFGQTAQHTTESSLTTIFMGREFTHGQTADSTMASGKTTRCMAKAFSPG